MSTNSLDRLDKLIESMELEHEVACLHGGNGNRDFESTSGALKALRNARDVLAQTEDPEEAQAVGHIVRKIVQTRLFGLIPIIPKIKGSEWLHIGDMSELKSGKRKNGIIIGWEVVDQIEGTREQILRTYLERKNVKIIEFK